ncbi:MAG TPA: AgmX/PglI C-terminal domain-containing protein [Polyangiaceae bacterium]|nr:AgmX/PglI C-terminal domain-containing protein [Polyangiaceae bacterium]
MGAEALSSLGVGVLLSWALLPLLAALARRSRDATPAAYHRTLACALLAAPLLALTPAAKLALGSLLLQGGAVDTLPVSVPGRVLLEWAEPILAAPNRAAFVAPLGRVLAAIGGLWLGVFALGVLQLAWARACLRRRLRAAAPAPEAVRAQAAELAQRLGVRPPAMLVSAEFVAPFATGLLAPVVGLDPRSCALGPVELRYALEHELSHIARGDTRLAFCVELVRRCFLGHPSARWLIEELGWAREAAVDARVAGDSPSGYAHFLVASAERWSLARAASTSSVFMADTALARRIEMLTSSSRQTHSAPKRFALFGASALGLGLAALAPASCGAPQAEAGPSRAAGVAGSGATAAPPSHSAELQAGRIAVSGAMAPAVIRAVLRDQFGHFRECYEGLPQPRPAVASNLNFTIGAAGNVTAGQVDSAASPALGQCLERVLLALHFPAPRAGDVSVEYPMQFEP